MQIYLKKKIEIKTSSQTNTELTRQLSVHTFDRHETLLWVVCRISNCDTVHSIYIRGKNVFILHVEYTNSNFTTIDISISHFAKYQTGNRREKHIVQCAVGCSKKNDFFSRIN